MAGFNFLPSGVGPGTMPAATPGLGSVSDLPSMARPAAPASPLAGPPSPFLPPTPGPQAQEYKAVTQADGSILLHLLNFDGSLGPAVKIINPIKPSSKGAV